MPNAGFLPSDAESFDPNRAINVGRQQVSARINVVMTQRTSGEEILSLLRGFRPARQTCLT